MKYIIHGESKGVKDQITIEGDTIEELRQTAKKELEKRQWKGCWSEKIDE